MFRKIILAIGFVVFLLLLAEMGWRAKGFKPYQSFNASINMRPDWMYDFDSTLGLRLHQGKYQVVELDTYHYTATIDSTRERITSYSDSFSGRPSLIILGAGSSFGQGLNDNESFPFVLQTLLPHYKVRNRAVMGYGLSNNYTQLVQDRNLKKGDAVIYIYHADQNNRNSYVNQKRSVPIFSEKEHFSNYHFISIDSNLQTRLHKFDYHIFPLSPYSALANYLEDSRNAAKDSENGSNETAKKAILSMDKWCKDRGVEFKLVCWKDDNVSLSNIAYFSEHGVHAYNIKVVIAFGDRPANELAWANKIFADSLALLFEK